jgi:hypothetical protein
MKKHRSEDQRGFWEKGIHYYYYYIKRRLHVESIFNDLTTMMFKKSQGKKHMHNPLQSKLLCSIIELDNDFAIRCTYLCSVWDFYHEINRPFAWWHRDTTTTRIIFLAFVTFICSIVLVLSEELKHLNKNTKRILVQVVPRRHHANGQLRVNYRILWTAQGDN